MTKTATILVLALLAGGIWAPAGAQEQQLIAFTGVNVLPMDRERVIKNQTVVVKDGRIVEVGPAGRVRVPAEAQSVEAKGKYLMPGMAEMHGHIPPPDGDPPGYMESVLFLYVANGVTTVRGMLGHPGQLDLRKRTNTGELLGPNLYLAGPSFSGGTIKSVDEAIQRVKQQKEEGWDLLKIHPGLTREQYDAVARTAKEVGMAFAGHVPADVGLLRALEAGQETIDHMDGYIEYLNGGGGPIPREKMVDVARRTKQAGVWVIPTMVLWETILGASDLNEMKNFPELQYVPRKQVADYISAFEKRIASPQFNREQVQNIAGNRKRLLKVLNDEGVKIIFGTDAPQQFSVPGFSMHREARLMRESGMTPYAILRSGTASVGEYFKDKDRFGQVAAGHRADLILLDANPIDDLGNLARRSGVMVRGRWLPESEIQQRLKDIAAKMQ